MAMRNDVIVQAKFDNVKWMKDGESIDDVMKRGNKEDFIIDGSTLTLFGGKQQLEGDYQCVAGVSGVRLSNRQVVKTTLVSDPIKLRRARITKFDQTTNHYVHVKQGQVARLPCAGLPDVVPGPAEICFIKSGSDSDECLSDKVDSNYLSTSTGMQISVVQPHHAGEYYCVVRNEYTKQTRKSPRYVKLRVDPTENGTSPGQPDPPQLVFPSKENRPDSPISVDVVAGQDIILECVFVDAKVVWIKYGDLTPQISLTDDEARLRQVWGNLRIRQVNQGDSGMYSCHGLSPFDESPSLHEDGHPKVYYSLIVHSPTDVHLEMNQNVRDKSWQCISRPAMDEAEIYGPGLERGRSHNLYVVSSPSRDHLIKQGPVNVTATIGDDVELICLVIQRVNSKYWLKEFSLDGSYVPFGAARTQRVGSNSLKIHKVEKKDEGWYTCVVVGEGSEKSEQQAYLRVNYRTTTAPFTATVEPYIVKNKDDHVTMEDVRGFVTGSHVRIQWSVIGKMEALSSIAGFK
ncbi:immunoglobulin domain protein [Teladorsagia circumcincta]|uniref:Immunoglobulin domain protein n=1 Tax=Teladorsagia circumcincta TaxID=45464 RepID=A0A2G9UQT5_TELCI|nr:immunoglobulin domain protein [Teladorsagia circumcincta]